MGILKEYEKTVLSLLVSEIFSYTQLNDVICKSELVSYEYTGCGYFLSISHPYLPDKRIACDRPVVNGKADDIDCGFVIFLEKSKLTLECYTWNDTGIPEDFRDKNVQVKTLD